MPKQPRIEHGAPQRRGWDSNPRGPCEADGLANRCRNHLATSPNRRPCGRTAGRRRHRRRPNCPSWVRTRTLLIQSQACCQLHQGAPKPEHPQLRNGHAPNVSTATPVHVHGKRSRSRNDRAGDGARTRDPQLGKLMLYQLSYSRTLQTTPVRPGPFRPAESHRSDLNRGPLDYESSALPLSYGGAQTDANAPASVVSLPRAAVAPTGVGLAREGRAHGPRPWACADQRHPRARRLRPGRGETEWS